METAAPQVLSLLFDFASLSEAEFNDRAAGLTPKLLRWLAIHHPDNRTRKRFFAMTGVAIGAGTVLNSNLVISDDYEPLVTIGCRVAVGPNVTIVAASDPNNSCLRAVPYVQEHLIRKAPVTLEDDCWIGAGVVLLPGVTVGARAVVGAGAVVCADVPPDAVAAGVPATVKRRL